MTDFSECADLRYYRTAPQDWFIATSDLVNSTKAIDAGKYHAINSCGVASITAVMNACGDTELPFSEGDELDVDATIKSVDEELDKEESGEMDA